MKDLTKLAPADIGLSPRHARTYMGIMDTIGAIPTESPKEGGESLRSVFSAEMSALEGAGLSTSTAAAILRYQLLTMMTNAWVDKEQSEFGLTVGMVLLRILWYFSYNLRRHDRRLDKMHRWRSSAVSSLAAAAALNNRVTALEAQQSAKVKDGPDFTTSTTGAVAGELLRFTGDASVTAQQGRKLLVRYTNSSGSVQRWGEVTVFFRYVSGALQVDGVTLAADTVSDGGSVAAAVSGSYVVVSGTGVAGQTLTWTTNEVPSRLHPDPLVNPARQGAP